MTLTLVAGEGSGKRRCTLCWAWRESAIRLATGITTVIATPICFAAVSAAPVIGQVAGYPACAVFAAGGAAFTAYEAYETYWEFEQAFSGSESGPPKSRKEQADACQLPEEKLVSPL